MKKLNQLKLNFLTSFIAALALIACNNEKPGESVKVDINNTGQPIEKYIYGQFIEHLGRSIYGGLWAEMLSDRKFYYPIVYNFSPWAKDSSAFWNTGPYTYLNGSPWEMIGTRNSVKMDTKNPYTGKQSVTVEVPGNGSEAGIKQARLAVVANKKYTGHIVLSGSTGVLPIIVQLKSSDGKTVTQKIEQISNRYTSYPFEFTPAFSGDSVALEIYSTGKGTFRIGTVSLMPADNLKGWRSDVVALLKELDSPVYRWPGGNFVSGYNWMDGIGERDKRPPRKNPAWKGVEPNDVGIHEYMELMNMINAEPYISVNTGLGTVEDVAKEVEYCNGSVDTEMGKLRAENGHPEPYNVKFWAVGNEMYGNWQLGHMPLDEYVKKHNRVAEAIWKVDPDAKLVGVGSLGKWDVAMLSECSDYLSLLSEHVYCRELDSVPAHTAQLADAIRKVAKAHRVYNDSIPQLAGKNIRIAMDEWNYWYGDYIYGELGVRYHLKDALGVARGLHEYFRNSDLFFMANYAQTVNVIGAIKTTRTASDFATTALPLIMYRHHFGTIPVKIENNLTNPDVSVALTSDKKFLTIAAVNSTSEPQNIAFDLENVDVAETGSQWLIHNSDPESYNVPGKEPNVKIVKSEIDFKKHTLTVPGYADVLISLEIK